MSIDPGKLLDDIPGARAFVPTGASNANASFPGTFRLAADADKALSCTWEGDATLAGVFSRATSVFHVWEDWGRMSLDIAGLDLDKKAAQALVVSRDRGGTLLEKRAPDPSAGESLFTLANPSTSNDMANPEPGEALVLLEYGKIVRVAAVVYKDPKARIIGTVESDLATGKLTCDPTFAWYSLFGPLDDLTTFHRASSTGAGPSRTVVLAPVTRRTSPFPRYATIACSACGKSVGIAAPTRPGGPVQVGTVTAPPPLFKPRKKDDEDEPLNPVADWVSSQGGIVILADGEGHGILLPAAPFAVVPSAEALKQAELSPPHFATDLGTLFEVPAVGAGGTRVFRAGTRFGLVVDAGSDPGPGRPVTAAVYLDQINAVITNLGITRGMIQVIHAHKDHISGMPSTSTTGPTGAVAVVPGMIARLRIAPRNLIIPVQYLRLPEVQKVVQQLRGAPQTQALGYTPTWFPGTIPGTKLKNEGGTGNVFRNSYKAGELVVELVGLRPELRRVEPGDREAQRHIDSSSLLMRVTRPADEAKVVILGDLRGEDLTAFRTAMDFMRAGSWAELFEGVTTISGFSHHVGRLKSADVAGIMSLLEVTLVRTGRLRVVEQTNPGVYPQARADTMELLSRLGVELVTAEMPPPPLPSGAPSNTPSAAGASRDAIYSRGPDARARATTQSPLTDAIGRLRRMVDARRTIGTWRPFFESGNPKAKETLDKDILPELERSIGDLQTSIRTAVEAAVRVRAEGQSTGPSGARDYTAAGGARGAAFAAAVAAIPATTAIEGSFGTEGFESLENLRRLPAEEVPLEVALNAALVRGEYSDKAFQYMLQVLGPGREALLTGPRGGLLPRLKAFERVRAQYGFQSAVLGSSEVMSIPQGPQGWSRGMKAGGRLVGGALLAGEVMGSVVEPLVTAIQTGKRTFSNWNLVPFLRRLFFWQRMGVVPIMVGVDDGTFSVDEETDIKKVVEGLNADKFNALYFQEPGISDGDAIRMAAFMAVWIRNLDEFDVLFEDSFQDAVVWEPPVEGGWPEATWKVKVGRYKKTLNRNFVEPYWYTHPKLTELMQAYVPRVIANTEALLAEYAKTGAISKETEDSIGTLTLPGERVSARAHLKPSTSGTSTPVKVESAGTQPTRERVDVSWWSPPRFYVYGESGDYALVGGADYNTYATLRRLGRDERTLTTGGEGGRQWVATRRVGNTTGQVYIHLSRLEADAPYELRQVAPEGILSTR